MRLARIGVALLIASVLALQVYAGFSTMQYNNYHWPFVNYPMYSASHRAGDSFATVELRGVPCGTPSDTVRLTQSDLHLTPQQFLRLVQSSGAVYGPSRTRDQDALSLRQFVDRYVPRKLCGLQIWRRKFVIGRNGLQYPGEAWEKVWGTT